MTMLVFLLIPLIMSFLSKYTLAVIVPIVRFGLLYMFYIPIFSVIFLSSVYFIFFTN